MKRRAIRWIVVTILLCAVSAGATYGILYWRYTVPLSQCSEVYQRYHDTPGIQASFIKDKQINDTLCLDMTLFEAEDSLSFANLLKSWNRSDDYITDMMSSEVSENARFTSLRPKGHPELPRDNIVLANNDVEAIFPIRMTVAIFHTRTGEENNVVKHASYWKEVNIKISEKNEEKRN